MDEKAKTGRVRAQKRAVRKKPEASEPISLEPAGHAVAEPKAPVTPVAVEPKKSPVVEAKAPAAVELKKPEVAESKTPAAAEPKKVRRSTKAATAKSRAQATAMVKPTFEQIQLRAYFISERRRKQGMVGDEHQDWVTAENELRTELVLG